jgi:hypothetical protein
MLFYMILFNSLLFKTSVPTAKISSSLHIKMVTFRADKRII